MSTPRTTWLAPHYLCLILLGFLMPLGAGTRPAQLADPQLKIAVAAVAGVTSLVSMLWLAAEPTSKHVRRAIPPLMLYLFLVTIATVTRQLPQARIQLFVLMPVGIIGFIAVEKYRPGAWVDVCYRASILSLIFTAVVGTRTLDTGTGQARLGGSSHPVFIGLESCLVALVAWHQLRNGKHLGPLLVLTLAGYTLVASFSRTAIISLSLAVALGFAVAHRSNRILRLVIVAVGGIIMYRTVLPGIVDVLRGQQQSLTEATGRVEIWDRVLHSNHEWLRGYGFFPLHDGNGPDANLWFINEGLPVESSPIQAALTAGLLGFAAWTWLAVRVIRSAVRVPLGFRMSVVVLCFAMTGSGMAGSAFDWWWLLALAAVPAWVGSQGKADEAAALDEGDGGSVDDGDRERGVLVGSAVSSVRPLPRRAAVGA